MYGLKTVFDEECPREDIIDIIAVPGISGDQNDAWEPLHQSGWGYVEFFSHRLLNARLSTYTYPLVGGDTENFTREGLNQEAKRLLVAVNGLKRTQRQGIVFVGHDIGGTLALIQAAFGDIVFRDIYHSTFMLLFLGCPHISDHSTNRDGSLTRLLGLNNELTSQPRKLFATCLSDVIQTVNIDFVDLTLYLVVVVCNVFSVDENLEKRVFLQHESKLPIYYTALHFQEPRSLSHSEVARDISEPASSFIRRHIDVFRQRKLSNQRNSGSSLSYASRLQMEDHPFPREINAALKAAIQKWASTHKTPFLIAQNVDNFQSAKTNIANCIMKSSISNTSVVPINYFFDFDEFDSRANTVEAMMSTLFTQSTWELEEDALSACTSTLSNQRLGWNKTDRFNVYYRTILTRSDVEISWIFANLNENIESYSWLLEILSTVATRCDFHFRVVFLNRNFQDFALDAEYVTVINWANPETTLTLALATMDQQSLDSINDVSGRGNTDLQLSFEAAELSALQVIEKNTRIGFLGPKLIDLFHKSEVSYEHKKMIGIWASYYHTPDDADIIRSHLSSSLEPNLDTTFQLILDAAVPGPWSSASAIETLELIALSFRSLTYNELGDLEEAYKELKPHQKPRPTGSAAILSWLPGILDLHGREVHLSHSGFRQFLFSQNGERLYLSEKEMARSQSRLALLCLEYLLSSHGRGLLESAAAGARDIGAPDPRMGFVSYAVSHWPKHAQLAGVHLLLEANPVNRFLAEQAMLDTWTKVYWKYSSKPIHLNLDRLSPLAIFAEHGLDTLLIALIEKYEGTDWLAEQLTNAFVVAARNGMTNTVRLLFERQSIGPNTSTLLIQASLQSGDKNTLSFAISKALHIADPWECFSVTVCQALAAGQHGVAVTMLSHSPWHKLENKKKKEMLMAASEGGDAQSLDFILDKCEGLLCEEDIFYATLEATGNGYATVSASLFGKLLKMVNTRNDTEHKLKNGVIESSKSPEQNFGKQLTTHLRGATVAEPPSDIRNSEPKAEEGIVVVDAQETSAEVNTDPASGTSTKELNAGSTYGVRVLEFAIQKGQYDVIQAVMDVLCETKTCISSAQTLLENAITLCRPRCFNALLLAFSHANAPLQDCAIFDKKELLIYALRRGSGNFVQGLLSNGAVLDETMFEHVFDNDLLDDDAKSELVGLVIDEARKTIKESALVEVLTRQLVTALKLNAYGAAKRLIQAGANVNTRDVHGTRTPLYHAVYCGDVKMVEALLEAEADVNIAEDDDSRWLPIHAGYDNVEILKLLLAAGADVNATFEGGGTVLYLASKWGLHECVEEILKHKPNLDDGTPMVYSAVCNGHEAIVSMLLNAGANPLHPATADHNECLLHACTEKNYVDILNRLLLFNFDLEHKDKYGRTALNCRNTANNIPALRALIRRGAQIDTKDQPWNDTPLSNAVREGDVALAEFFISEGADVNINIDRGLENTPLLSACAISSLAMVKMLIKNGANTSVVSVGVPGTLFQAACLNQTDAQPEILSYLLENELADVHQASKWWGGNLNTACLMADINVVDLLIGRGADVSLRDKIGRWPVQFALYRSVEFVKRLCNRGPDQSSAQLLVKDAMQRNALHFAVVSGRLDLVRYVITQQKGLAKEKDCDGWTPLFWAARKCYKWDTQTSERAQIIQELLNDGADIMSMAEGVNRTWTPYTLARYHGLEDDVIALLRPTEDQISNSKHRMFWQESISARAKVAKYDDGAYCDICLMGAVGIYYDCTECPRFAICFKCYRSKDLVHDKHQFVPKHEEDEYIDDPDAPSSPVASSVPSIAVVHREPLTHNTRLSVSSLSIGEDDSNGSPDSDSNS